jgi:hypothetical protein
MQAVFSMKALEIVKFFSNPHKAHKMPFFPLFQTATNPISVYDFT